MRDLGCLYHGTLGVPWDGTTFTGPSHGTKVGPMSRPAGPMGRDGTVPYGNSHGSDDV
jgi:hypothetical protein